MRICYFGGYDREHVRNRVLISGLRLCGAEVVECHSRHPNVAFRFFSLIRQYVRLRRGTQVVVVGACCHAYVPLAWLLCRLTGRPLVFDAFVSLFEIWTDETGDERPSAFRGWSPRMLDKVGAALSDLVLFDTEEHVSYFSEQFRVPRDKLASIPVGADDRFFHPQERQGGSGLCVLFAGTFLPLHGVETIAQAAALLEDEPDIRFELIGDGKGRAQVERHPPARNLTLRGCLSYEDYARRLCEADAALGAFGSTPKARRVIPCKVYDALAAGVPLVTGDTPSVRRILSNRHNALLVAPGDARALADAVLLLKRDPDLRLRLSREGRRTFEQVGSPLKIGRNLLDQCRRVMAR